MAQRAALAATLLAACAHTGREAPGKPQLIDPGLHFTDALNHLMVEETGLQRDGSVVACMMDITRKQLDKIDVEDEIRRSISITAFRGEPVYPSNTYSSGLHAEKKVQTGNGAFIADTNGPYTLCVRAKPGDQPFVPQSFRSRNSLPR